jgi:hypothetical protein
LLHVIPLVELELTLGKIAGAVFIRSYTSAGLGLSVLGECLAVGGGCIPRLLAK